MGSFRVPPGTSLGCDVCDEKQKLSAGLPFPLVTLPLCEQSSYSGQQHWCALLYPACLNALSVFNLVSI